MSGKFCYLRGMAIALILFIERVNLRVLPFPPLLLATKEFCFLLFGKAYVGNSLPNQA